MTSISSPPVANREEPEIPEFLIQGDWNRRDEPSAPTNPTAAQDERGVTRAGNPGGPFDYAALNQPVADSLRRITENIRSHSIKLASTVVTIGNELLEAKTQLGHGEFQRWIDAELGFSRRTVQNFIAAAKWVKGKNAIIAFFWSRPRSTSWLNAATPIGFHRD
ncbi:MAG TPA: DUF3102 domain-containing protein [Prosthecobacter sp.]|nr:DUF3102 domain-containing protein [Prosthecobacter sp.]